MKVVISSGHGKYVRGASGFLDEVDEARKVVERVADLWRDAGVGVDVFHDNTSTSQNQNLTTIVNYHNSRSRDYDVSVHFNAYQTTSKPMGHETLYVTQETLATEIAAGVARAGGFINRGPKYRSDLYFLNNTAKPAVLLEVCFVDSSADADLYGRNFEAVCVAIAETIGQVTIGAPPVEPPPEPVEPPPDTSVVAHVDIQIKVTGSAVITINGQDFMFHEPGPEEPSAPLIPPNQQNIICTVFGGEDDPNNSAYDEHFITDTELGCALPDKFQGDRPQVRVFNTDNELSVLCDIVDVGPWNTDDPYWQTGTRPQAESGTDSQGRTTNGAGIDLTPGAASAIRLDGKGTVNWMFEEVLVA